MRRSTLIPLVLVVLLALPIQGAVGRTTATQQASPAKGSPQSPVVRQLLAAQQGKAPERLPNGLFAPSPSGAMATTVAEGLKQRAGRAQAATNPTLSTFGCPNVFRRSGRPDNIRVNQDCGFRWQSEEWISVNPTDPRNLVVSQNDSKQQGNRTGVDFSLNGGRNFGDSVLPNGRVVIPEAPGGEWSFDAFTDPASAFDSRGNYYYTAIGFDAFQDAFAGVFVWKSNSCLRGSALHTPGDGSCRPFQPPLSGSAIPIRTNFDNPSLSDDKQLMAADYFRGSPFRDNVYVTWTIFDFSCGPAADQFCESPIFFSRSTDGGVTWSEALEISGRNPELCSFGNLFNPGENPNSCNFSQGSYPVVGPDGAIYVVFNNVNTSEQAAVGDGIAQQLLVKSTDGGLTWTQPVKVGDDHATQPFSLPPDHELPSGCPPFRQCLPPNGYRLNDFPSMGIDHRTGKLAVFWADFRNGGPCELDTSVGVPLPVEPCANHNNDVFVAVSEDAGATWGPTRQVTGGGRSAQWQPWGDVGEDGRLYVAYYDRKYGSCEQTGCNDITLSSSGDGRTWSHQRITTSSMPNLTCENNPAQCGFLGDYMSTVYWAGKVHMVWGDTRGRELGGVPEEDIYYATVRAR